ncbi:CubicO group peptidase (beta-lactamase class C family) [Kitasatospora sp. MAA19]|uniref:serine hydrolase domain-containing protein n=1 Tax=Kitasatospora sp. MAA19 TaxID=3035090 RepID=UPI002474E212|nr:serine hydrolase domain-containing protein [Kitasatospora sp. MAA19]MDH6710045.1 CubicO group peptidase (beta-lactamase class C family) [Kitasatospora sp. MAA19]
MNELARLVQQTADRLAGQHVGAVVAGLAGGDVEIRGAGRAGPGGAVPGPHTLFEIGSVTKVFTSLVLARLVLAGSAGSTAGSSVGSATGFDAGFDAGPGVGLDQPLADVLAGIRPGGVTVPDRGGRPITLRHLATHTSGLPRLPRGLLATALLKPNKPDPYAHCDTAYVLAGLARTRLRAAPGRSFRYSNLGAGLLGLALAHRAGTGYEELVAREVCQPLGLVDTCVREGREQADRLAQGHTAGGRPVPHWELADIPGMGGLRSTAADLAIFLRAQLAADREPDAPLAPAITLTRETRHRVNPFAWMHLGWLAHRLHTQQGGHLQIWHNGGTGGFRSFVAFDPEKQVGVVVLVNTRRSADPAGTTLLRTLQNEFATAR